MNTIANNIKNTVKYDPLGDGKSSVELIDYMGDDLTVVNAARVSLHKQSEWDIVTEEKNGIRTENKRLNEKDVRLINYLAVHQHWTPFSQCQLQFRIKMPIFVSRQWYKHQVGFTRNEVSRRYVSYEPELFFPSKWRLKADNVKQGSSDETIPLLPEDVDVCNQAVTVYNMLLKKGICPEQARMILPQNMYTEFVETASLAAYSRLCKLRLDPHAQKEIQLYAQVVLEIISHIMPVSWNALMGTGSSVQ
ncbi:FAD-dependent thymidylate synthase [bacterium]|nr:FAD-dependent thymidylate synthase [bacterium]